MKVLVLEQTAELAELIGLYLSSISSAEVTATEKLDVAMAKLKEGTEVFIFSQHFLKPGLNEAYIECVQNHADIVRVLIGDHEEAGCHLLQANNLVHEIKEMTKASFWRKISGRAAEMPLPLSPYLVYRLGVCPADLFLKLGDNNWVKLFHAGNPFGEEEQRKFETKGVKEFYVLPEDVQRTLGHFEDLLSALKSTTDTTLIADANEFIWFALKENGFREEIQRVAQVAIQQSLVAIRKDPDLKMFLERIFRPEHQWMVRHNMILAHVACAIAQKLGWTSEQTYFKIVTAAILHDLALPRHDMDEDVWLVSAQGEKLREGMDPELKAFIQHPIEGSQIIRRNKLIAPDTDKILLEHHELPDGSGFPRGLSGPQISPLGAVFILAHAFSTVLLQTGGPTEWSMKVVLEKLRPDFWQTAHFKKAWQALEKCELFP
jgi:HD-GYP domain-containing protein (c-di-GMP phosphodiesterase class II)